MEKKDQDDHIDRAIVFIDGNNLYHRLKDRELRTKVDIGALAQRVVGNRQLEHIYYYNAPPPGGKEYTEKANTYYAYVQRTPNLTFRRTRLQKTQKVDEYGSYSSFVEKGGDTALSTDLITLAATDEFDIAIIITNDGDYEPAVCAIRDMYDKRVEIVYFEGTRPFVYESCALMRAFRLSLLSEYDYDKTPEEYKRSVKHQKQRIKNKPLRERKPREHADPRFIETIDELDD